MRLKRIFQHRAIDILILLLISFFIHRNWFQRDILIGGEVQYLPDELLKGYVSLPYLWNNINCAGSSLLIGLFSYPIMFLWGVLTHLFTSDISFLIIYSIPLTVLPVLTMYFLVYRLFNKDRVASFFASLFFSFNTYILHLSLGGHPHGALATALVPLPILFFILGIDKNNLKYVILGALALTLQMILEVRFAYLSSIIIIFYFLYHLFRERRRLAFKEEAIPSFRNLAVFFLIPIFLHFYWILPMVMQKGYSLPTGYGQPAWAIASSAPINLAKAITVFHPWTWVSIFIPQQIQLEKVRLLYWGIPFLAFLAPCLAPKDKKILFFTFLALIFIFFAKGTNPPLGKVYLWCFKHLPGFDTFRDPSKFFMGVILSYSVLFGYSIATVYRHLNKKIFSNIFLILCLFWFFYLIYPGFKDQLIDGTYTPYPMSKEFIEVRNFIKSDDTHFRTLWFPSRGKFTYYSGRYPRISAGDVTFPGDFDTFFYSLNFNKNCLNQTKYLGKILGILNVKYIILPPDKREKTYEWFSTTREACRNSFLIQKDIIPTQNPFIFRNQDYLPRFFLPKKRVLIVGGRKALLGLMALSGERQLFQDQVIFFADEFRENIPRLLEDIDAVIFYKQDFADLTVSITSKENRIDLWDYAVYSGENDAKHSHFERTTWPPNGDLGFNKGEIAQSFQGIVETPDPHRIQKMKIDFKIEEEDLYEIWIRSGFTPVNGSMELTLDGGREKNINTQSEQGYYHWVKYGEFQLLPGKHILKIIAHPDGRQQLDQIVVLTKGEREKQEALLESLLRDKDVLILSDIAPDFKRWDLKTERGELVEVNEYFRQKENYTVKWKEINPTEYRIEYTQNAPGYLIFSESYNPNWVLKLNNENVIHSQKAYGRINSFYVKKTGKIKGTVEYTSQRYVIYGLMTTGVFCFSSLCLFLFLRIKHSYLKKAKTNLENAKN